MKRQKPPLKHLVSNPGRARSYRYYIYALWCPLSKKVRYVGMSGMSPAERLGQHIGLARRGEESAKSDWIRSIMVAGDMPQMRIINAYQDREHAFRAEAHYISLGAMRSLTNKSKGCPGYTIPQWKRDLDAWIAKQPVIPIREMKY